MRSGPHGLSTRSLVILNDFSSDPSTGYTSSVPPKAIQKSLAIVACLLFLETTSITQVPAEKPLPDLALFWERVRAHLGVQYDPAQLLKGYAYRRKSVTEEIAPDGSVKNRETRDYDVFHFDAGRFQKLISKNDRPLSEKDLKNEEERFKEFLARKPRARPNQDQEKIFNDILNAFDFKILERQFHNRRPTLVIAFKPRENAQLQTFLGRRLFAKAEGTAWVDEEDAQLVSIAIHFIDDVKVGLGLLASISKDSRMSREWQRLNDGTWVPLRNESRVKARVLLAKGYNRRRVDHFTEYKKFSAEAPSQFLEARP